MKRFTLTVFATLAAVGFASAAQAECRAKWSSPYGSDGVGIMTAVSGKTCGTSIRHGSTWMDALSVVGQAKNGKAWAEGLSTVFYRSKPGFHGTDSFTFQSDYGVKGKSNVTITVTVE